MLKKRVIFLILIASFLIRIIRFDYPLSYGFAWGDGTRDFLVANHILKYQEFPLVGPFNLLNNSGIKNSPIYFYLFAFLLLPFNNILTLSVFNILIQTGLVLLIYLITKKIFDQKTAIISALFYSFNWEVLHQSDFIWQPNLMLPIMAVALLFLTQRKVLQSSFFMALAFAIHNSAFSWVVAFLALIVFKKYLKGFFLFIFSLFIFYLPVLIFLLGHTVNLSIENTGSYFFNFSANIHQILSALNINNPLSIILVIILISLYFWKFQDSKKKLMGLMLLLFFMPILFASFFNKIRLHYLLLAIPPFVIFISRLVALQKNKKVMILLATLFFIILTSNLKFITHLSTPLTSQKTVGQLSAIIKEELLDIQKKNGFKDFSFFQIRSFTQDNGKIFDYPTLDTILLVPLEQVLNQKLSKISDESIFNHIQINNLNYLVITCHKLNDGFSDEDCLKEFPLQYPKYVILKNLYIGFPISVYIAKHE